MDKYPKMVTLFKLVPSNASKRNGTVALEKYFLRVPHYITFH